MNEGKDRIKVELKEAGWEDVGSILVADNRD
jgi:hypothetical protein